MFNSNKKRIDKNNNWMHRQIYDCIHNQTHKVPSDFKVKEEKIKKLMNKFKLKGMTP